MKKPSDDGEDSLHDNLAFVRSLVEEGHRARMSGGRAFFAAGLCYGVQCLIQWAEIMGWLPWGLLGLIVSIAPTVVFLAILGAMFWNDRKASQHGVATRALNAAFSSAGLANLFMIVVFGFNAAQQKSMTIWLLYPVVVCAFQGAVWFIAYMIRKKLWLALVSAGWFATTLVLGFLIQYGQWYVLVLGLALIFIMGGSGYAMMVQAKK